MSAASTSITLEAWLEEQLGTAPPELAETIRSLLGGVPERGVEGLVTVALDAFETVADGPATRSTAPTLLAADAILTYAFEAAVDPRLGGSAARAIRLAEWVGPHGRIGARFGAMKEAE
ncbi:hypothetical protein [Candidatus Palauibacter sp.]|uniref:hypothetical protein n=1 Tax=Candidatus Palauibacter sp. TaxID=3101350 RepID=UPI003B59B438